MNTNLQLSDCRPRQERIWLIAERILFRVAGVYFLLYWFPFPLDVNEWASPLTKLIYQFHDGWVLFAANLIDMHTPPLS